MHRHLFLWPVGPSLRLLSHGFDVYYIIIMVVATYTIMRCIRIKEIRHSKVARVFFYAPRSLGRGA